VRKFTPRHPCSQLAHNPASGSDRDDFACIIGNHAIFDLANVLHGRGAFWLMRFGAGDQLVGILNRQSEFNF